MQFTFKGHQDTTKLGREFATKEFAGERPVGRPQKSDIFAEVMKQDIEALVTTEKKKCMEEGVATISRQQILRCFTKGHDNDDDDADDDGKFATCRDLSNCREMIDLKRLHDRNIPLIIFIPATCAYHSFQKIH